MKKVPFLTLLVSLAVLISCGGKNTSSPIEAAGDDKNEKDKLLNTGAAVLQDKSPLGKFSTYLNGFHFYNGNLSAQMEAHHYVNQVNGDLYQAIIFDGNGADAKLMGVEYIVTEQLFNTLPEEEKKLWHSHHHEVKSGTLVAPGIPQLAEHELMEKLVSTYGKTIHTWHTDQQRSLPVGIPLIMMGFTRDGQLRPGLLSERDRRFRISTQEIKGRRNDIPLPRIDSLANAWERGEIRQLTITTVADSAIHKHQGVIR